MVFSYGNCAILISKFTVSVYLSQAQRLQINKKRKKEIFSKCHIVFTAFPSFKWRFVWTVKYYNLIYIVRKETQPSLLLVVVDAGD